MFLGMGFQPPRNLKVPLPRPPTNGTIINRMAHLHQIASSPARSRSTWAKLGIIALGLLSALSACDSPKTPKPIECPKDTELLGQAPPYGNRQFCGRTSEFNLEGVQKHGPWRYYWPNGSLQTLGYYKDGLKEGTFRVWIERGQKIEQGKYQNGAKQGVWKGWHRNGKLKSQTQFLDGKIHGFRKLYDQEGKLSAHWEYFDGEIVGRKTD